MENQETQENQPTQSGQAELSITDLQNLKAIVDVAIKRGTFVGAELSSVGNVYDKVNNFLNSVSQAKD